MLNYSALIAPQKQLSGSSSQLFKGSHPEARTPYYYLTDQIKTIETYANMYYAEGV